MNALLSLVVSGIAGVLLGLMFFGGLRATIRRLDKTRHPAMLMLGSLLLRFGLVLAGFFLLARYAGWQALLAAAAGFTLPRLLMARRLQARPVKQELHT